MLFDLDGDCQAIQNNVVFEWRKFTFAPRTSLCKVSIGILRQSVADTKYITYKGQYNCARLF